jgi:hypothetical protein
VSRRPGSSLVLSPLDPNLESSGMVDPDQIRKESLYAKKIGELRELSDEELVRQHDDLVTGGTAVSQEYYLQELARRDTSQREASMVDLTAKLVRLTWAIFGLTVVNVAAVIVVAVTG